MKYIKTILIIILVSAIPRLLPCAEKSPRNFQLSPVALGRFSSQSSGLAIQRIKSPPVDLDISMSEKIKESFSCDRCGLIYPDFGAYHRHKRTHGFRKVTFGELVALALSEQHLSDYQPGGE